MKKLLTLFIFVFLLFGCSNTHTVSITYEPNGGTILSMTTSVNSNSPSWYPLIPQKLNFRFVNWYIDQQLTQLYTHTALIDNTTLTLYAKYIEADQEDFYIVEFVSMGGTFTPNQLIASGGLLIEPAAPEILGSTFQYWGYAVSDSNKQGEVNFSEPITEHLVVEAIYLSD
ncbi:MAG: InlB B-repeat-containing protein [Bacillota bacterium]